MEWIFSPLVECGFDAEFTWNEFFPLWWNVVLMLNLLGMNFFSCGGMWFWCWIYLEWIYAKNFFIFFYFYEIYAMYFVLGRSKYNSMLQSFITSRNYAHTHTQRTVLLQWRNVYSAYIQHHNLVNLIKLYWFWLKIFVVWIGIITIE